MRTRFTIPMFLLSIAACGGSSGDGGSPVTPPLPPPPPPPAPVVAVVEVSAPQSSVLAGGTVQVSAVVKDAQGNTLSGRTVTFSTSNTALATVSSSGLVTTILPGSVVVNATSEAITGSLTITIINGRDIPFFVKPFAGEFPTGNFLDHSVPKEFIDNNGTFLTYWGELLPGTGRMVDGHNGYDWQMPTGTPVLAAAPGRVVQATFVTGFCPPLGMNVNQGSVIIEHALPGGIVLQTRYEHVSRIDVTAGQIVTAGTQVALSGNTGCTAAPHLHFDVHRLTQTRTGQRTAIDPYGWTGSTADPWEQATEGAASIQLWQANQAPRLWREVRLNPPATPGSAVLVSRLVYQGIDDAANPNNEFVELSLDTRVSQSVSLNGYSLRGDASGVDFPIPIGITLTAAQPKLTLYTGSGTNTATEVYLSRASGIWANSGIDCLRLVAPSGTQLRLALGGACP